MPELPEVHTTIEGLKKKILGRTIKAVWSDFHIKTAHSQRQNLKNKNHYALFKKIAVGAKIKNLTRMGKNILIHLANQHTMVVHMKLTGCLMYDVSDRFVHLKIKLDNGKDLVLSDVRKFASVSIIETPKLQEHERLDTLGPDALKISSEEFGQRLRLKKNWPIKSALLDQMVVAGIGNIYSDEMLFASSVHPLSLADKIPASKYAELYKTMRKILLFSIKHGGDSKSDYRNAFGEKGGFQNFHQAYGKKGQPCPKVGCPGIIARLVIKGRSAHFCPKHQKQFK